MLQTCFATQTQQCIAKPAMQNKYFVKNRRHGEKDEQQVGIGINELETDDPCTPLHLVLEKVLTFACVFVFDHSLVGVEALGECLGVSRDPNTQEVARDLLETLPDVSITLLASKT